MALLVVGVLSFALRNSGVWGLKTSEWKRRTVYQVVTDRFALAEGDRDTCQKYQDTCPEGTICGGTWKGITEKLDYIQGMGFDAIWISPVIDQTHCGYHGYWPRRLNRLNSFMGTDEELSNLMKTAKSKNMAVLFDSFFNHVGPSATGDLDEYYPLDKPEYYHGSAQLATKDGTDDETCSNFNYSQPFNFSAGHCLSKCAPLQYFREVCWMGEHKAHTELPDLNQDHPKVAKFLMDQTRELLKKYEFDGLRVDAAPYMNRSFLQRVKNEVLPNTWVVGEVLVIETTEFFASFMEQPSRGSLSGSGNTEEDIRNIEADNVKGKVLDGIANHELFNGIRDALLLKDEQDEDKKQGSFQDLMSQWHKLNSTYPDIGALTNFVDSHDEERWHLKSQDWDTYKNALTLAFFLPGIPIALYGAEQGIKGGSGDTKIRVPMWSTSAGYSMTSPLYQWTRRLVMARKYMLKSLEDKEIDEIKHLIVSGHFLSFQRGNTIVVATKHPTSYTVDLEVSIPTHLPPNTLLCDSLEYDSDFNYCEYVNSNGNLDIKLNGRPRLMAPPEGAAESKLLLTFVRIMVGLWLLPLIMFFIITCTQKRVVQIIQPLTPQQIDGPDPAFLDDEKDGKAKQVVLIASIEHIIVPTEGKTVKVVAGGLGKVAGLLCQHHPGPMISVHPCMCEHDYSFATPDEDGFVYANLMGEEKTCQTFRYKRPAVNGGPPVTFILVDHPMFRDRKDGIYPAPNTRGSVLAFYSLWNQVVARIIDRERPDIFHCPDYHNAMAVLYLERPIPVVVTLHNAEYQGTVDTQQMRTPEVRWLGDMFNLDESVVRSECVSDGSFNMLLPIVRYCKKYQRGYGLCGVSRTYAQECFQKYNIFWGLPELRGIENCMPESERFVPTEAGEEKYWEQKRLAKESVQREYDLELDPDARLFVFLGRWVKQKGMDYITDVAEWMLATYPKAQLVMIGPVGDSYGSYCRMKMQGLLDSKKFEHRLFVYAGFMSVSKDLKLAADFCLMPSRDEPFGYVDIEFAWYGAAIVGSFRGGLAKLPGFYFKVLNKDSPVHCQGCLKTVISAALEADVSVLQEMSVYSRKTAFPVEEWCQELLRFYGTALTNFQHAPTAAGTTKVTPSITESGTEGSDLEKPLLHGQGDGNGNSLGLAARPALKNGNKGGMPTILSVGNNLAGMADGEDAQVHFSPSMQEIPQFSHEQFLDLQDNTDAMSVSSLETSQEHRRSPKGSAWSRQVTPMLSMAREHSGAANSGREMSGLSTNEFLRSTTRDEDQSGIDPEEPELDLAKEFLRQEPLEEDVTGIVEAKSAIATFTKQDGKNADVLLEETLWDLELSLEFDKTSQMLGSHVCGIPAIDWIISFAYVVGPLTSIALMGSESYSPTTAFGDHTWEVQKLVTQGFATIVWTYLACKIRSHKLMAFAVFIRIFQAVISHTPDGSATETLSGTAILCGTIQAGDIVLIYFAFMAQSVGDISKLAVRTGLTMALQSMTKWLITPLHDLHAPGKGHVLEAILFGTALSISLVVPIFILRAPQAYRNFNQPNFWPQFAGLFRLKVAALMGLSSVFAGLTYAPSSLFMVWRSRAPRPDNFHEFCIVSAFASLAAPVLLAILTLKAPDASINVVKAFACFSFPAFALQCWPMLEVTHAATHATSVMVSLDVVSIMSVILDVMRVMASAVAILSTIGSRWRFSAYLCVIQVLTYFSSALSFPIIKALTRSDLPMEIEASMRPQSLTDELMFVCLLFCIPEIFCRVLAFFFLDQEMLGTLWTARHRRMEALLARQS